MKKRILSVILATMLTTSMVLSGCGGGGQSSNEGGGGTNQRQRTPLMRKTIIPQRRIREARAQATARERLRQFPMIRN